MNKQQIEEVLVAVGRGNMTFGDRRVERRSMYIRKNVSALGGKFRMIDETTDKGVGITNFPKGNMLIKGMDIIVLGVRAKNDITTATPTAGLYRGLPLAPLQNAELTISQDGVLLNSPMDVIFNNFTPTKIEDTFFGISPTYISSEKTFEIEVEVPTGLTVGATTCLDLQFDCLVLVK